MSELNNQEQTNKSLAPKIEKISLDEINKSKSDDIVDKIMEKILKIK